MSATRSLLVPLLLTSYALMSQGLNPLSEISSQVEETSGLIVIEERIVTHNDSGGGAFLFELDESSGDVRRKVTVLNASNRDWEDIDLDPTHIFIGDFGNNNGTRRDLKLYKLPRVDYLDEDNVVTAEIIEFSYEDQTDFSSASMATNFDAEALIAMGENLYVFTKNWIDNRTHVYQIPKNPGKHVAIRVDEFDVRGLVTGAAYNSESGRIALVGYSGITPFLTELNGFSDGKFSNGTIARTNLRFPFGVSVQVEAVAFYDESRLILSSEGGFSGNAGLLEVSLSALSIEDLETTGTLIYPNPAGEKLWIDSDSPPQEVQIYDYSGRLILTEKVNSDSISLERLPVGNYIIRLQNDSGESYRKLIRQ